MYKWFIYVLFFYVINIYPVAYHIKMPDYSSSWEKYKTNLSQYDFMTWALSLLVLFIIVMIYMRYLERKSRRGCVRRVRMGFNSVPGAATGRMDPEALNAVLKATVNPGKMRNGVLDGMMDGMADGRSDPELRSGLNDSTDHMQHFTSAPKLENVVASRWLSDINTTTNPTETKSVEAKPMSYDSDVNIMNQAMLTSRIGTAGKSMYEGVGRSVPMGLTMAQNRSSGFNILTKSDVGNQHEGFTMPTEDVKAEWNVYGLPTQIMQLINR